MTLIKGCLFAFSSFGYWEFLRKKLGTNVYFLPIITLSIQVCVLFIAGLLYILPEAALGLYLLGLVLFIRGLFEEKKNIWKPYWNLGYGYLCFALLIVFFCVKDSIFYGGDDFNHWATVMKKILEMDRFPNFKDSVIEFQHYPLGSSISIYYFCKMVHNTDGLQLFAQGSVMVASLLPLFAFAKRQRITFALMLLMTNVLFGYNTGIQRLLVDTLLPLESMSAVFYLIYLYEVEKIHTQESRCDFWLVAPMMAWATQIKNSGLLFAVFAAVFLLMYLYKDRRYVGQKLVICAIPLICFFLWDRHCTNSFEWSALTKHAMTAMNYIRTFSEKGMDNILAIVHGSLAHACTREGLVWIVLWLAALGGLTFLAQKKQKAMYLALILTVLALHIVYIIGVIGMFLFSMPFVEAMELASIERYLRTMDIAVYCLLLMYTIVLISNIEGTRMACLACAVMMILGASVGLRMLQKEKEYFTLEHRRLLENIILDYGVEKYTSCFICIPFDDSDYYKHLGGFLLDEIPKTKWVKNIEELEPAKDYELLINMDPENPLIQQWLAENYPDQKHLAVISMDAQTD